MTAAGQPVHDLIGQLGVVSCIPTQHGERLVSAFAALSFASVWLFTGPASAAVMISQVYGGGGNSGATYSNDFVELHNSGAAAVSLAGWSVQYASASGTTWGGSQLTPVTGSIPAGGYYLVQLAAGRAACRPSLC